MGGPGEPLRVGIKEDDPHGQGREFEAQGIDEITGEDKGKETGEHDGPDLPGLDAPRRDVPILGAGILGVDIRVHQTVIGHGGGSGQDHAEDDQDKNAQGRFPMSRSQKARQGERQGKDGMRQDDQA